MQTIIWILILAFLWLVPVRVETSAQAVPADCPIPAYDTESLSQSLFEAALRGRFVLDPVLLEAINATVSDDQRVTQPSVSADGTLIAYVVLTGTDPRDDGRPTKPMYEGENPRFRNPLVDIRVYDVESGESRTLVDNETLLALREEPIEVSPRVMNLQWIPDSHQLSFNSGAYAYGDGIFESMADDLWRIDVDSGELTNFLPQGEGGVAVWSPDGAPSGAHAAVMDYDTLKLITITGEVTGEDVLPEYQAVGLGHTVGYPTLIWENANAFVITTTEDAWVQHTPALTLWRVFVDEQQPEIVGQYSAFFFSFYISPDLERVVYWRTMSEGSNQRMVYLNTLSGDDEQAWGGSESGLIDTGAWVDDLHFTYLIYGAEGAPQPYIADVCGQLFPVE